MATARQTNAARKNVAKAQEAVTSQRSTAHMPKRPGPRSVAHGGAEVTTADGLAAGGALPPVQQAFIDYDAFQAPPDETRSAAAAALGTGYRHIDTAAAYGNEREVGEAVRASRGGRAAVFLETKIWISDYGYDETLHAFDKSAGKLGVDQIDLHPYFQQPEVQAFNAEHGIVTQAWCAENFDVFDFELTADEVAAIDGLDAGKRGGPEPDAITLESFGRQIPEA